MKSSLYASRRVLCCSLLRSLKLASAKAFNSRPWIQVSERSVTELCLACSALLSARYKRKANVTVTALVREPDEDGRTVFEIHVAKKEGSELADGEEVDAQFGQKLAEWLTDGRFNGDPDHLINGSSVIQWCKSKIQQYLDRTLAAMAMFDPGSSCEDIYIFRTERTQVYGTTFRSEDLVPDIQEVLEHFVG